MRTDIVVQNVASFRIDPAILARPDRRLVLITSAVNWRRLRVRQREDVFAQIVVLESFQPADLAEAVRAIRDNLPESDRDDVALLCHDEYSLHSVAQVREKLNIPGDRPEQLTPFVNKIEMKRALRDAGVRLPRFVRWDHAEYFDDPEDYCATVLEQVGLPAFVKPVSESGSVGTAQIRSAADLKTWAESADPTVTWEVDEFLDGKLYHVDTVYDAGALIHVAVNEYLHPCFDYIEGKLNCSFTVGPEHPAYRKLVEFNRRVLAGLADKPERSVFHHEIFELADGELVFLEIAARAPAAMVPQAEQIRHRLNIEEAHFKLQRGEQVDPPPARLGPYAAWVFFAKHEGRVRDLIRPEIPSDHRWTWNVAIGDEMSDATDIRDFCASALIWNDDLEALKRDLRALEGFQPILSDPLE